MKDSPYRFIFFLGVALLMAPLVGLGFTIHGLQTGFVAASGAGDAKLVVLSQSINAALHHTHTGLQLATGAPFLMILAHVWAFRRRPAANVSKHGFFSCALLCLFLGWMGAHRFSVGRTKSGVFFLLTLGGLVIGKFVDFIRICWGTFTDSDGRQVRFVANNALQET